ncbi:helix-turn-helix domain-containing protein [Pseudaestuariivita sp.]|uniref:helix-turn-helix domain-containing protein n=1 Tax=Pseudaestuariivita sp. TaxID=2211669 RepID=UPI00405924E6
MATRVPSWALLGESAPLPGFLHVESIAARAAERGWHIHTHQHPELAQFLVVSGGGGTARVAGADITFRAPYILRIAAGTVHGYAFLPDTAGHVVSIVEAVAQERGLLKPAGSGWGVAEAVVLGAAATIERLARVPGPEAVALVAACLRLLDAATDESAVRSAGRAGKEERLKALLAAQPVGPRTPAELADALAVTPGHLNRLVRQVTGMTTSQALNDARMRHAAAGLLHTTRTIAEIGQDAGFDDPAHFSRRFKAWCGAAPSEWRQGVRGKAR